MSRTESPSTAKPYGLARVTAVWGVAPLISWTDKTHHTQPAGCRASRCRAYTEGSKPSRSINQCWSQRAPVSRLAWLEYTLTTGLREPVQPISAVSGRNSSFFSLKTQ